MNKQGDTNKGQPYYIEKEHQEQGKIQNGNQNENSVQNNTTLTNNLGENCDSPNDTTHSNSNLANGNINSSSSSSCSYKNQNQEKHNLQAYPMFDSGSSSQAQNEFGQERDSQNISQSKEKQQGIEYKQQIQSYVDSQIKKQEQQNDQSSQSDYQYLYYVSSSNHTNDSNNNSKSQGMNENNSNINAQNKNFGLSNNNNNSPQDDSSSKMDYQSKVKPSKVLLVMVQNPQDQVIEHRIIFEKFSFYGEVEQILIFCKRQPWKMFVDMSSIESSIKAKNALENSSINVNNLELKMKVQFSSQQTLVLKNGNGGINYKDLNKKFEKTQLSYSIKIDPTQNQNQNFYQSAQILDINRRHIPPYAAAQSMQLPNPQLQMLKMTDPTATAQSMTYQVGVPQQKVQMMSTSLIQQDQNQYMPQQMAPIIYTTGRDSPQMIQNPSLTHPKQNFLKKQIFQLNRKNSINPNYEFNFLFQGKHRKISLTSKYFSLFKSFNQKIHSPLLLFSQKQINHKKNQF